MLKKLKQVHKSYKIAVLIFCIIILLLTALYFLPRATLPVIPPDKPVVSDYIVSILIAAGKMILITLLLTLYFCLFLTNIWSIIDILKSEFKDNNDKFKWLIIVILLGIIGAVIYLSIGTKQKNTPFIKQDSD